MLFSEPAFVFFFFPLLCLVYYWLPQRARNLWLLLASLFFYWWGERLFILMLISIGMNYGFGLLLDPQRQSKKPQLWLWIAVFANLGFLGFYKYGNFVFEILNDLRLGMGWQPLDQKSSIHLPIGISFYTFQALSYVLDVHRGQAPAQRNPLSLGLYISLFPQLIMGPIVRYCDIAGQIAKRHICFHDLTEGLRRFVIGLAKKSLVANAVGQVADICFAAPTEQLGTSAAWLGITAYILQLYFDFSGYSDMAIGLGRIFGFRFPENFRYPYIARSVTEMWQRWHITLGSWFRDYLYIPMGGNRVPRWRLAFNLLTVFVLCGLWHGAAWTFLLWGLWNGAFLILERMGLLRLLQRLPSCIPWAYTMLGWMLGMVLFRCLNLSHTAGYLQAMCSPFAQETALIQAADLLDTWAIWGFTVGIIASFPIYPWARQRFEQWAGQSRHPACYLGLWQSVEALVLITLLAACLMLIAAGSYSPFLYTQF